MAPHLGGLGCRAVGRGGLERLVLLAVVVRGGELCGRDGVHGNREGEPRHGTADRPPCRCRARFGANAAVPRCHAFHVAVHGDLGLAERNRCQRPARVGADSGQFLEVGAEGLDVYNTMLDAMGAPRRLGPARREHRAVDAIRA